MKRGERTETMSSVGYTASPLMHALNEEGLLRARKMLTRRFVEGSSLDEVSTLRAELLAKLSSAEAKLKSAVEGKLDSLKRAVDLMEESTYKLTDLNHKMNSTEKRIALTDTTISNYSNVKRIHFARDNIDKVIYQVEFFTKIPETVATQRAILNEEPLRVKEVYVKCLELQAWRSALLNELLVSSEGKGIGAGYQKRISLTKAASARTRSSTNWDSYSQDMRTSILQKVGSHLEIVLELSKEIKSRLLRNIDCLSDVASSNPAQLVSTFEVIEMHQEYVDRRMERARLRRQAADQKRMEAGEDFTPWDESKEPIDPSELGGGLENSSDEMMGVDMKDETRDRLVTNLIRKVKTNFADIAAEQRAVEEAQGDDEEDSVTDVDTSAGKLEVEQASLNKRKKMLSKQVTSTLNTATRMIGSMVEFKNGVCVCIPPSYHAMSLYMDAFENQLRPQIEELVQDYALLEVSEIMQLIDWLEYYVHQTGVFEEQEHDEHTSSSNDSSNHKPPMRACCRAFLSIAEELMHEYLHRIKKQVMQWFDNIKKQPLEVGKAGDGTLITSMPEDMFNVIHMQMTVARDKLAKEHLKDVVNACMQVLREVQRQTHDSLAEHWSEKDPESMCAWINDMQRMQEKSDEFAQEVMSLVPQETDRQFLLDMLDSVSTEYLNLALKAVTFLSRLVLKDLEEDVFSQLYTPKWESTKDKGDSVCAVLTATFKDYFVDISEWIPSTFFIRFLRDSLTSTVLHYTMAMRKLPSHFQFTSELAVARSLITDMEVIHEFFLGYLDDLATAGLGVTSGSTTHEQALQLAEKALEEEMLPLTHLARVVSATHVSGALPDVRSLCIRWGRDGLKLVLCVISSNPSLDKTDKQESMDIATKTFDQLLDSGAIPRQSPSVLAAQEFLEGRAGDKSGDLMDRVVGGFKDGLKRTGTTLRKTNWTKMKGWTSNRDLMGSYSMK